MNLQPLSIALMIIVSWLAVVRPAVADAVVMSNGDRLTGKVVREDEGRLELRTGYAGVLKIDRKKVTRVLFDEPAPVLADDERAATVATSYDDDDRPMLSRPPPSRQVTDDGPKVEATDPEPWEMGKGHRLEGRVNLSLENDQGNSPSQQLGIDFMLSYRDLRDELESYAELAYETTRGVKTTDNWSLNNKYSHFLKGSRWYGSAWLRLKHDYFADLRLRYLVGPGLGYKFFDGLGLNLRAEIGPIYLNQDFYEQDDTHAWGPALFLDYDQNFWDNHLQLYHRSMGYASVGEGDPNLWVSWTGLRMPMSWGVVGTVEYKINYDSDPAPGTKSTDTTLGLKIGYEW